MNNIYLLKTCYKTYFSCRFICRISEKPYLCIVFFIVLDLRLTKVGVQRYSFFYAHTSDTIFQTVTHYTYRIQKSYPKFYFEIAHLSDFLVEIFIRNRFYLLPLIGSSSIKSGFLQQRHNTV